MSLIDASMYHMNVRPEVGSQDVDQKLTGRALFPDGNLYEYTTAYPGGPSLQTYGIDITSPLSHVPSYSTAPIPPAPAGLPHPPVTDTTLGAVGTAIFSGFVRDLGEYNPKLFAQTAFPIYEKMRRSDGDVQAALLACKLPIRAAEKQVLPGVGPNSPDHALAKEIADLVRDNLFNGLEMQTPTGVWQTQSFETVEENALLSLDFGCAAHEDIWAIDGDRVRLVRMAPRLPITFYRFWPSDDGETLLAIEQYGYRKNEFINVVVPAEKICLFNHWKEGANFYGISILRAAYKHWYIKENLYKIDAVALERNAMGIPTFHLPEGYIKEDRDLAEQMAKNLVTHEQAGVVLPPGWVFEINGIKGRLRDPWNSIRHHSEEIVRSVLAMFMALGTTVSGSRALGSSFLDFFFLSLEASARHIADSISNNSIRRLVDYNFTPKKGETLPYPRLEYQRIVVLDPIEVAGAVKDLANAQTDILQPDDELENYLRRRFGLPLKTLLRPRFLPVQTRVMESPVGEETIGAMERGEGEGVVGPERPSTPGAIISQGRTVVNPTLNRPPGPVPGLEPTVRTPIPVAMEGDIPVQGPKKRTTTGAAGKKVEASEIPQTGESGGTFVPGIRLGGVLYHLLMSDDNVGEVVAVDFDGVLAAHTRDKHAAGEPIPEGLQLMRDLQKRGYRLIIFTARTDRTPIKEFLAKYLPDVEIMRVTNTKPVEAIAFLDNRAIRVDAAKPKSYRKAIKKVKGLETVKDRKGL